MATVPDQGAGQFDQAQIVAGLLIPNSEIEAVNQEKLHSDVGMFFAQVSGWISNFGEVGQT
jgi:hypothetical protein